MYAQARNITLPYEATMDNLRPMPDAKGTGSSLNTKRIEDGGTTQLRCGNVALFLTRNTRLAETGQSCENIRSEMLINVGKH